MAARVDSTLNNEGRETTVLFTRYARDRFSMPAIYSGLDNDRTEPCDSSCCCLGCTLIGYLFFCKRMRKRSKIQILWGWLMTLAALSCLILGVVIYSPDNPYAALSDMRPVKHRFDYLFCAVAEVKSPTIDFDAFLVTGDLETNRSLMKSYNWNTAVFVDAQNYEYFSFYFLAGSILEVHHCPHDFMTMYLFKSVHNFDAWKQDHDCEFCYIAKHYIMKYVTCNDPINLHKFSFDVESEDEYFLVYASDGDGAWLDLTIHLNRTSYDLQNAVTVCTNVIDCRVDIDDRDQTAVYLVKNYYDIGMFNHPEFTTRCVPRIWAYLLFHGVIVLVVGVVSSCLIQKFCKDPQLLQQNGFGIAGSERSPLLRAPFLPPSYSSATLYPPKYEDLVISDEDKDLPSYSDVMAASLSRNSVRDGADSSTHANGGVTLTNGSPCSDTGIVNDCRRVRDRADSSTHAYGPLTLTNENIPSCSHTRAVNDSSCTSDCADSSTHAYEVVPTANENNPRSCALVANTSDSFRGNTDGPTDACDVLGTTNANGRCSHPGPSNEGNCACDSVPHFTHVHPDVPTTNDNNQCNHTEMTIENTQVRHMTTTCPVPDNFEHTINVQDTHSSMDTDDGVPTSIPNSDLRSASVLYFTNVQKST